ncbi:response regulator [Caenispirillum bisanense]|uniref:response regulator n=1 Tax=Caenispirillum bisanense TaxID=414052 RepID=UPI0031D0536C
MPLWKLKRASTAIVLIATLFVLATLLVRSLFLWVEYREAIANAELASSRLASLTDEHAQRTIQTAALVTRIVAETVERAGGVRAFTGESAHAMLRELADMTPGSYIMVTDAAARPTASGTTLEPPAITLEDREWFQAHAAGQDIHVGRAIFSRVSAEVLFTFSRAIRAPSGMLQGTVQVAMQPHFFQDVVADSSFPGQTVAVWNLHGDAIARTGLDRDTVDTRLTPSDLRRILDGPAGSFIGPFGGERAVVSYLRVAEWPLVVTAAIPVDAAFQPLRRSLYLSVALLVPLTAGVLGLALVGLRLSRREEQLARDLGVTNTALTRARTSLESQVTERTAELAATNIRLTESEAKLRGIFDTAYQFICLLSPGGTVLEINRTALDFLGLPKAEVVGRPLWDLPLHNGGDLRDRLRAMVGLAAEGAFIREEIAIRSTAGRVTPVDFSLKAVRDDDGAVVALVAEGRDIAALKDALAQLHEAQKVEMLGHLTGGVAHDFNNILMAILGNLELLRKRAAHDRDVQRLVDAAVQGTERGALLTQRLLAFARRQDLQPVAFAADDLVLGLEALLRPTIGPTMELVFDLPGGLPPVHADRNQTELALLNLCVNARDAMPVGGRIRIGVRAVAADDPGRPAGLPPRPFVCIAVTDTGTGMDEATAARATEPFYTTKGPGKGSGLGLSMVQGTAAQSGGTFRLHSRVGEGTTAEVWLPVAEGAAAATVRRTAGVAPGGGDPVGPGRSRSARILVVDDDLLVLMGTTALLEDMGHEVLEAASGPEALEIVREEPELDLVITDYAMPGMTGFDLIQALREDRPGLPVILATGYAELPPAAEQVPFRLSKPYRNHHLAAMLSEVLDGETPPVP